LRLDETKHLGQITLATRHFFAIQRAKTILVTILEVDAQNAFVVRTIAAKASEDVLIDGLMLMRRIRKELLCPSDTLCRVLTHFQLTYISLPAK